jgi:imidazole glycerol phosphate synthase subunit HisF
VNGFSKIMLNGMDKLNLNSASSQTNNVTNQTSACHGLNCCGIYVKSQKADKENSKNDTDDMEDTKKKTWWYVK